MSMPTPPTPGDLFAGRPPRPLTARPVDTGGSFRDRYLDGILHSGLSRNARLVALALGVIAQPDGSLPVPPGIPRLRRHTGLIEGAVRTSLHALAEAGWVHRTPAATTHEPSLITLTIPPGHA